MPISLQLSLYKLYSGILASKITDWALRNNVLCPSQKGFLPFEGTYEHVFSLQTILDDSRRHKKSCYVAWLDLRNAFGTIPHDVILDMMRRLGAPNMFRRIVADIYSGSSFQVKTADGLTPKIPLDRGVKQGYPLSPILFNIVIEGMLRGISRHVDCGYSFAKEPDLSACSFAYADDLALVAESRGGLDVLLHTAGQFANWSALEFRPDKCASLGITYQNGRSFDQIPFLVQGGAMPTLSYGEHYTYLGKPTGAKDHGDSCRDTIAKLIGDTDLVMKSPLAPWQKLVAFKTFLRTRMDYHLRVGVISRTQADKLDRQLRGSIKSGLGTSSRANEHFFYSKVSQGGLGIYSVRDDVDNAHITTAFKMLSSPDLNVRRQAHRGLIDTCVKRRPDLNNVSLAEALKWLCSPPENNEAMLGDITSFWIQARTALVARKAILTTNINGSNLTLSGPFGVGEETHRKRILFLLHTHCSAVHLDLWKGLRDQGKVARSASGTPSSHSWLRNSAGLRDRDYIFAINARLNLLPVRAIRAKFQVGVDKRCPRCNFQAETLPHVLNHCECAWTLIRARHDDILHHIVSLIPRLEGDQLYVDCTIPNFPGDPLQRPDIVLMRASGDVVIVDLCCPFDNGGSALVDACNRKKSKYNNISDFFLSQGRSVFLDGLGVGALGSWIPSNNEALSKLGIKPTKKLQSTLCAMAIRGSYNIWKGRCLALSN